jgi:hypothetical protein
MKKTIDVLKEFRFDLYDRPDPALNYIKALENAIQMVEVIIYNPRDFDHFPEIKQLLEFNNQYE